MLSQLLSFCDLQSLKPGDELSNHPEWSKGKIFTVANISNGLVYAISVGQVLELKIIKLDEEPDPVWWVAVPEAMTTEVPGQCSR